MSNPQVELHIANYGVITLELDADKAPKSVENFLSYVNKGHYNNTIFHRVIPGFMVQGGGFEPGMKQKNSDAPIQNEANNGLKNANYTVAMARTSDPHSATAQFFINVADNGFLTTPHRRPRAGAMPCSARSFPAPTWWTRSRPSRPAAAASMTTCRRKTWSSRRLSHSDLALI
jgi:peptidyl-prolyl cis-trans isomerase B (cyclophilin B)